VFTNASLSPTSAAAAAAVMAMVAMQYSDSVMNQMRDARRF